MDLSAPALLLGLALAAAPPVRSGLVAGTVLLERKLPPARVWKLEEDMVRFCGLTKLTDATWLVGKDGALANCVVLLYPRGSKGPLPVAPLLNALFEKVGPGYEPRVLVVPLGTTVSMRNRNSPCQGFISGSPLYPFSVLVPRGRKHDYAFDRRAGPCPVRCQRPYMIGWVYVVDTPYYAKTGPDGRFLVPHVPPGDYTVRIWHEAEGRLTKGCGPLEVTVRAGQTSRLTYRIK